MFRALTVVRPLCRQLLHTTSVRANQPPADLLGHAQQTSLSSINPGRSLQDKWKAAEHDADLAIKYSDRRDAYSGRRVLVGASKGVAGAFSALHSIMVQNQVKKTLYAHTRHEKKGPKRRRLRQMRWHNLFAHTVRRKVALVNEIRKRGA